MDERWTAHLASDTDGIASLIIVIVVPGVFITAELIARRRDRAGRPDPSDASDASSS